MPTSSVAVRSLTLAILGFSAVPAFGQGANVTAFNPYSGVGLSGGPVPQYGPQAAYPIVDTVGPAGGPAFNPWQGGGSAAAYPVAGVSAGAGRNVTASNVAAGNVSAGNVTAGVPASVYSYNPGAYLPAPPPGPIESRIVAIPEAGNARPARRSYAPAAASTPPAVTTATISVPPPPAAPPVVTGAEFGTRSPSAGTPTPLAAATPTPPTVARTPSAATSPSPAVPAQVVTATPAPPAATPPPPAAARPQPAAAPPPPATPAPMAATTPASPPTPPAPTRPPAATTPLSTATSAPVAAAPPALPATLPAPPATTRAPQTATQPSATAPTQMAAATPAPPASTPPAAPTPSPAAAAAIAATTRPAPPATPAPPAASQTPPTRLAAAAPPEPVSPPILPNSSVAATIGFASQSAVLSNDAKIDLDRLAKNLGDRRPRLIEIRAYAGVGDPESRKVSLARALVVRSYLIDKGIKTRIEVGAYGGDSRGGGSERVDILVPNS